MIDSSIREERRKYYRLTPSLPQPLQAEVYFSKEEKRSVEVMNLSPGGLLCYTSNATSFFVVGRPIPRIEIFLPDKKPVRYAGVILRFEPSQQEGRYFCAIQFTKMKRRGWGLRSVKTIALKSKATEIVTTSDDEFLQRVRRVENYTLKKDIQARQRAYESFDDITALLPLEERWWFYEILDEMKRREPNYPEDLKREFLKLCRGGSFKDLYSRGRRQRFGRTIKNFLRRLGWRNTSS